MGLPPHIKLPCRQCIGCKLQQSAGWATRCIHEAKSHEYNSWITLTYDDDHLPSKYNTGIINPQTGKTVYSGSLDKNAVPRLIRQLRKALSRINVKRERQVYPHQLLYTADMGLRPIPPRYYYGGEYGERYRRPHYHLCLFGLDFQDKVHERQTDQEHKLYKSQALTTLWPYGQHMIGDLTWETAAYTARYIMKKINGQQKQKHYEVIDKETGEIIQIIPEFNEMSRRPGIGNNWYEKYNKDIYKKDESYVILKGQKTKPPRYYDKLHDNSNPEHMDHIKQERFLNALQQRENYTTERLLAEEIITTRKTQSLKQKL